MNKKGSALFFILLIIVVLTILSAAIISRSISESRIAQRNLESNQAFWLAEAGMSRALNALRVSYDTTASDYANIGQNGNEVGGCSFAISVNGMNRLVVANGCVPAECNCNPATCRAIRTIQAMMNQYQSIPAGFYDNAIYSAGNVSIGSNCPVTGNVFSGAIVTGSVVSPHTITQNDPTLHEEGLPALTFSELRQKSIDQGWYNPITKVTTYPANSFYNELPSGTFSGVPNVVFVDGDFSIVGGNQVVKGFIVVGGDLIYNAEIGGNATVDGCLYTRGNIWLHGGGGKIINVNGGVWAGGTVTLDGNEEIVYNKAYMDAIREGLHPNADVRIISWKEQSSPYKLGP